MANDNAIHHKQVSAERGQWIHNARKLLRKLQQPDAGLFPDLLKEINDFLEPK